MSIYMFVIVNHLWRVVSKSDTRGCKFKYRAFKGPTIGQT